MQQIAEAAPSFLGSMSHHHPQHEENLGGRPVSSLLVQLVINPRVMPGSLLRVHRGTDVRLGDQTRVSHMQGKNLYGPVLAFWLLTTELGVVPEYCWMWPPQPSTLSH